MRIILNTRHLHQPLAAAHHPNPKPFSDQALEQAALEDDFFVKRKLFPNVDFYSGIIVSRYTKPLTHLGIRETTHSPAD